LDMLSRSVRNRTVSDRHTGASSGMKWRRMALAATTRAGMARRDAALAEALKIRVGFVFGGVSCEYMESKQTSPDRGTNMRQLLFVAAGILISSAALAQQPAQQPVNKGVDGGPIGTSVPTAVTGSGGAGAGTETSVPIGNTVSSSNGSSGVSTGGASGVSTTTSTGAGGATAQLPAALATPKVENIKNGTQTGGIEKGVGTTLAPTQTRQGSAPGAGAINK